MPLISADFVTRLSGGAGNSNPNASLGGAKSSTVASTSVDSLFDQVSAAQATSGLVEYRCIYLHNGNASSTMLSTVAWISANTPAGDTTLDIGVGTSAVNGTEQVVGAEATAPSGVSFVPAATQGAGIALGDIPAGQHRAIWLRRTVNAAAAATPNDTWQISYYADFTS